MGRARCSSCMGTELAAYLQAAQRSVAKQRCDLWGGFGMVVRATREQLSFIRYSDEYKSVPQAHSDDDIPLCQMEILPSYIFLWIMLNEIRHLSSNCS